MFKRALLNLEKLEDTLLVESCALKTTCTNGQVSMLSSTKSEIRGSAELSNLHSPRVLVLS